MLGYREYHEVQIVWETLFRLDRYKTCWIVLINLLQASAPLIVPPTQSPNRPHEKPIMNRPTPINVSGLSSAIVNTVPNDYEESFTKCKSNKDNHSPRLAHPRYSASQNPSWSLESPKKLPSWTALQKSMARLQNSALDFGVPRITIFHQYHQHFPSLCSGWLPVRLVSCPILCPDATPYSAVSPVRLPFWWGLSIHHRRRRIHLIQWLRRTHRQQSFRSNVRYYQCPKQPPPI